MRLIDFQKFLIFMSGNNGLLCIQYFSIDICQQNRIFPCFSMKSLWNQISFLQQIKHAAITQFQQNRTDITIFICF